MNSPAGQPASQWTIGSAPDCDLVVAQPMVSGHHCRLILQNGNFWLEDLRSTNGTFLDGHRLPPGQPVALPYGARVTLGQQVAMPWPQPNTIQSGGPQPSQPPVPQPPLAPRPTPQPPVPAQPMPAPHPVQHPGPAMQPPVPPQKQHAGAITIGRSPESDVQIDLPIVSWNHARVLTENGRYILEDLNSRNGTAIDRSDNRITRALLDPRSDVYLGSYKLPAARILSGRKVEVGASQFHKVTFRGQSMIIGRDPQADIPLDFPMISWHHARLTRVADGIQVEDLGSRNGTFVNGVQITGRVVIKPGQEIGLGSFRFQMLEGGELAQREYHGNLTIEAMGVAVNAPNGQRLVEPVSLTVFPSELVALMGPAGAGKTTLLKALNGYTKPAEGRVLFNGHNLYAFYDRFRQQMGYVPQDDIVHPQLTVGEALYFSARLRTDLTDSEIKARTKKVLEDLGMADKENTIIGSAEKKTLSGGQRKRVNIALELINDTPVLFLDEPTSGLSSYDAESVMELLKDLSQQGKTIITTIHQPSVKIYKQFDDLIMLNRDKGAKSGAMVFFGPAFPDSIQFFNPQLPANTEEKELSPEMVLSGVAQKSSAEWQDRYRRSRYQTEFIEARSGKIPSTPEQTTDKPKRHFDLTQWFALVRRNVIVKVRDKAQATILAAQAPLFALLICLVYYPLSSSNGFVDLTPKLAGVHFLMVVAAIWFGCNNSARDIVGEWTVYKRERMVTLKLGSYVFSKLAVLFALCVLQCLSMLVIVYLALGLKSSFGGDLVVLVLSSMIGCGLGLCISAQSKTTESAIALLPIVLLPIIALGGGMRQVYQISDKVRWITNVIPSRWAFEANMLQETGPNRWINGKLANDDTHVPDDKSLDYLPDQSDGTQKNQLAEQQRQGMVKKMNLPPGAPPPRPMAHEEQEKPEHMLQGDVAEVSIPNLLITWEENGRHTVRAFEGETKADGSKARKFRHEFHESLIVLGSMLSLLIVGVLAILMRRDKDPQ